ncbi:ABC transporter substrate-binding protein, partial [Chloroflexota bacterium]
TLHYWSKTYPRGFDLHTRATYAPFVALPIFNNLVSFDPKMSELRPENIIGDLAEHWEISPDGKTYTFYLVKNAKWHDGKPFTAADVVYSIEKIVDPDPKRSRIYNSFPSFRNIEKVDDYTVDIHLKYPAASLLTQLAGPYAIIQPKHLAGTDGNTTDFLVGTGPFMFKNYTAPVVFELVRNPNYFKKGLPFLDGIKITFVSDVSTQVDVLVTNRVDMSSPSLAYKQKEQVDRITAEAPGVKIQYLYFPYCYAFWVNMNFPPFQDIRVRRALSLMIDPTEMTLAGYGATEFGLTGRAYFPDPWKMDKSESYKIMRWDKSFEERVTEAKKLMAEAGYSNGFKDKVRIITTYNPDFERMIATFADHALKYLNVETDIITTDVTKTRQLRDTGQFDLILTMAYSLTGDLDEYAGSFVTGGEGNFGDYSNPILDRLFEEESWTTDLPRRIEIGHEIERIILTELPILPTGVTFTYVIASHPHVRDLTPGFSGYSQAHLRMEYVWLDK